MHKKWLWIGQRLSDGFLYSRALEGLDVFFTCDNIRPGLMKPFETFSLPDAHSPTRWTSSHITEIVDMYDRVINGYLSEGYCVFPYYLSTNAQNKLKSARVIFNKCVFENQLTRSTQMDIAGSIGVKTPRWVVPSGASWSELASNLGKPIIVQFDNTSSGKGTFLIENEMAYIAFLEKFGEPNIAAEFVDDGYSCSTHLFITERNVVLASSSVQIIETGKMPDIEGISTFSFMGNDFACYANNVGKNTGALESIGRIGREFQRRGIYGVLGVDFIIRDGEFYYNETNFRLQNSTSLFSFLQQKGDRNVVNCLCREPIELAEVNSGFQYFTNSPVPNLTSGYYSYDGEFVGDIFFNGFREKRDCVLIFSSNYSQTEQSLRIIGEGSCFNADRQIDINIIALKERLVEIYG